MSVCVYECIVPSLKIYTLYTLYTPSPLHTLCTLYILSPLSVTERALNYWIGAVGFVGVSWFRGSGGMAPKLLDSSRLLLGLECSLRTNIAKVWVFKGSMWVVLCSLAIQRTANKNATRVAMLTYTWRLLQGICIHEGEKTRIYRKGAEMCTSSPRRLPILSDAGLWRKHFRG
jgi:hypothetical protein